MHYINYPEDFKQWVKNFYPNDKVLHKKLEQGDSTVGYLLDINTPTSSSLKGLIHALSSNTLDEFKSGFNAPEEKINLYIEWGKLYKESID